MPRGRSGGRYGGSYGGRNNFTGYHREDGGEGGRGGGRGGRRGRQYLHNNGGQRRGDQHPGISFLWNLPTDQPKAKITCMKFDSIANILYVGMDNGTVKIYAYNPTMTDKRRFVPSDPPQVQYPDCSIKSLMCLNSVVFVAMLTDQRDPGKSSIFCPNTQQTVEVPGKIEDCVLCTRAGQADGPSMWAVTTIGTVAVIDIKPGENNLPLMVPKAELNTDRQAHNSAITRATEVFCSAVNMSVLITGDSFGTLAVWNIANGGGIQKLNEGSGNDKAVTGIVEYRGTHFLVSYLNGTVDVFQFMAQPADGQAVSPAPLATYVPASAGYNATPAAALTIAVTHGPAGDQNAKEILDWLVVSRLDSDSLEVVQMDPNFKWGGELTQTSRCHAILPIDVALEEGGAEERLVVCAHGSIVKIFRWKG